MNQPLNKLPVDPSLKAFLGSKDPVLAENELKTLLEVAQKVSVRTLARCLRRRVSFNISDELNEDAKDCLNEVQLKVLERLYALKQKNSEVKISNYRAWVAAIAYASISDRFRLRDKARTSTTSNIRRIVKASQNLNIWDYKSDPVVGYKNWADRPPLQDLLLNGFPVHVIDKLGIDPSLSSRELIVAILNRVDSPIYLNDLVEIIKSLKTIGMELAYEEPDNLDTSFARPSHSPFQRLLHHNLLAALMDEIDHLNSRQIKVILLSIGYQGATAADLVHLGYMSHQRLAEYLRGTYPQGGFSALIDELPLSDMEIGIRIGEKASKVANIRKAIRERLRRRLKSFL
jgi:DNA-directed RNA polymerase specialized sigma24 family protein